MDVFSGQVGSADSITYKNLVHCKWSRATLEWNLHTVNQPVEKLHSQPSQYPAEDLACHGHRREAQGRVVGPVHLCYGYCHDECCQNPSCCKNSNH